MIMHLLPSIRCSFRVCLKRRQQTTVLTLRSFSNWKVAIVGSGPSGCYTAKYLNAALENSQIDILERLPTAYGLVRQGVAPDHPEVKNVANDFDKIIEDNDSIHFFGNVTVGKDVNLNELRKIYDIVVLAYGCESDRPFDHLKNSNVKNVMSAREFVAWYNGHVDFEWVGPLVQQALQRSKDGTQHIAVIGHGNVALDCARILAKTREELNDTDIPTRALDVLDNGDLSNQTRSISVVGRRGHVQGAFTIKELRELTKLSKADFFVRQDELDMGRSTPASKQELNDARPRKRIDKLLTDNATLLNTQKSTKKSEVHLRFLLNPIGFKSDDGSCLSGLVCERTRLVGDAGRQTAEGTGKMETLNAQLALVSIGYKGIAIPGSEQWFDNNRGVLKNVHGMVDTSTPSLGGLFVSGWIKRGPSGIIGTNIADAKDTVASIVDTVKLSAKPKPVSKSLQDLLQQRDVQIIDWKAYRRIDAAERSKDRIRNESQPREKITDRKEQLQAAFHKD